MFVSLDEAEIGKVFKVFGNCNTKVHHFFFFGGLLCLNSGCPLVL